MHYAENKMKMNRLHYLSTASSSTAAVVDDSEELNGLFVDAYSNMKLMIYLSKDRSFESFIITNILDKFEIAQSNIQSIKRFVQVQRE